MQLRDVIPSQEIKTRFGSSIKTLELGLQSMASIITMDGADVHATALNVWNRIVQNQLRPVDPQAIAPWVNAQDPRIYKQIEKLIGAPVFTDAAYFSARTTDAVVARVILFRVFPNSLHLSDVYFQNPAEPLPPPERKRFRAYRGYGLLPTLMENMKAFAREHGVEYLTLTAASDDLIPLFEKHGFTVEDNEMGRICVESGMCIPMEQRMAPRF